MAGLFDDLKLRGVVMRNRIGISPMCQYSAENGLPDDWHRTHLVSRAVGGAGLVIAEATGVVPEGRITPGCTGIWCDEQAMAWRPIAHLLETYGAVPGIQLAHAGRKASTALPWHGDGPIGPDAGGWSPVVAPSATAFDEGFPVPHELTADEIADVVIAFAAAAERALHAGFRLVELHGAHGYLMHSFHSPLANTRQDAYGGSFENRTRFTREVVAAVREVWPDELPLALRLSATDWVEGGWSIEDSVTLAASVRELGVDLVDCSSGGIIRGPHIPVGPGYQVPLARAVREGAGVATAAVGLITDPRQAQEIVASGAADVVLLGRESLRDPYWPRRAAEALGVAQGLAPPRQYARGW